MALIGWIVIMILAIGLILVGFLMHLLTGIGGSPHMSDRVVGSIQLALGILLAWYGFLNAPFTISFH
jgi:hypothetical protein